jgi:hypothetical protein
MALGKRRHDEEAASSFSSTSMFNVERSMFNVHPLLFLAAQPNATTAPSATAQSPINAYSENDALFGTATSTRNDPRVK